MNEPQKYDEEDEPLTPEQRAEDAAFEKKREAAEQHMKELEAAGWKWNKQQLTSPDDPEIYIVYDPFSAEQLLSPKLAAQVTARIKDIHSKQQGPTP